MTAWERLAEARIREWMERQKSEPASGPGSAAPVPLLELQLLEEIRKLHADAAAAREPAEAQALGRKAAALETRLLVLLESSGRPLAARHFEKLLQKLRARRTPM